MKDINEFDDIIYELNSMKDGPPLDPLRKASARRVYMAQAERIARNKFWVSPVKRERSSLFMNLRFALRAVLVLLLAFSSLFVGTAYAAESSLPGDALYPLNLRIENAHLGLMTNPARAIELSLSFSDERLFEVRQLISIGRQEYISSTLNLYRQIIAGPILAKAKDDPTLAASNMRIIETLSAQEQELRDLRDAMVDDNQDDFDQALAVLDVERQQHVMALNAASGSDDWPSETDGGEIPGDPGQDESALQTDTQETPEPNGSDLNSGESELSDPGQGNPNPPGLSNPGQGNPNPPGLSNPGQGNPTPPGLSNPGQGNPTPPGRGKDKDKDKEKEK
jgi:hypothetical protein